MLQYYALFAIAGIDVIFIALSQIALWQRKEYRLDRMMAYITSPEGSWAKQDMILISGIFLIFAYSTFVAGAIASANLYAFASMLCVFIGHALRIYRKGVMRPDFTGRVIFVVICTVFLGLVLFPTTVNKLTATGSELLSLSLAIFIFFLPVIIALSVYIVSIPAQMQKQNVVSRARAYRQQLRNLTVIGITGSVGKTSTKTYAQHFLNRGDESVTATNDHRNSPYVVALDMLQRVTENTKTYIVEMGAYTMGEIKELCEIVQPNIGVITAITNQHVALFGSLQKLAQAKWELADAIKKDGILILNKDDDIIRAKAEGSDTRIIWYSLKDDADVTLKNIVLHNDSTECDLVLGKEVVPVTIPVVGHGQLGSVLAGCAVAFAAGVDTEVLSAKLTTLPVIEKTMEVKKISDDVLLIDDSYSASEASVVNAIEFLRIVGNEKSLLVLVPIIELGSEGAGVHERIGRALVGAPFQVYVYGNAYKQNIKAGVGQDLEHITWYDDPRMLAELLRETSSEKNIIMLEGRLPNVVCNAVMPTL